MENQVPVKFEIYEGDQLVRTEFLTEQTIKIGKLSSSHVRIDDDDVSRMHAVVEVNDVNDVIILDLGSASGTFVNGSKVTKHSLRTGDEIRLGKTRIVVSISGQKAPTAAPAAGAGAAAAAAPQVPMGPLFDEDEEGGARALEVLALWGDTVVDVQHFTDEGLYTIGENEVSHVVPSDSVPEDPFPLARVDGGEMVVNVPEGATGEVMLDGEVYTIDDLKAAGKLSASSDAARTNALRLPPRARCRIFIADRTFLINSVGAAKAPPPVGFWQYFDAQSLRYIATSAVLHALFFGIVLSIPDDADRLSLDSFDLSDRWVEFMLKPEEEKKELEDLFSDLEDEGKAAEKAKDDEGKMGKKDETEKDKRFAVEGPQDKEDIELAREKAKLEALKTADAAFNQLEGELSAVWGQSDRAIGSDAVSALGSMFGDQVGSAQGFGGLGVAGGGRGGGGFGESSIGVGNIGTRGRGGGGSGYGRGVSRAGKKGSKVPKVIAGKPIISGSLDREIIRRIIRQHRAEYRYCYEKELQQKPDLNGKISVKFTIAGNGAVIAAKVVDSSMGNRNVESCIVKRIKRWVFPEPKGGGIVVVTYPFIFKPS